MILTPPNKPPKKNRHRIPVDGPVKEESMDQERMRKIQQDRDRNREEIRGKLAEIGPYYEMEVLPYTPPADAEVDEVGGLPGISDA